MPASLPPRSRRLRPAAPHGRGGASSMLRLSGAPSAHTERGGWLQQMARTLSGASAVGRRDGDDDARTSIITPLWPSAALAHRLTR